MIPCRSCHVIKPETEYAPHAVSIRLCRSCSSAQVKRRRGKDDPAKRLLFNLRKLGKNMEECKLWCLDDVQKLLDKVELSDAVKQGISLGMVPRFKLVRKDASKPFLPDNAVITL